MIGVEIQQEIMSQIGTVAADIQEPGSLKTYNWQIKPWLFSSDILSTQMWALETHQRCKEDTSTLWKAKAQGKQSKSLRIKWNEFVRNTGIPQTSHNSLSPVGYMQAMQKIQNQRVCHSRWDTKQQEKHRKEDAERKRNIRTHSKGEKYRSKCQGNMQGMVESREHRSCFVF